jgi:hypothetical protein
MTMRRILYLYVALSTLCLLTASASAQPSRDDLLRAQMQTLAELNSYSFDHEITLVAEGRRKTLRWRSVAKDDGRRHAGSSLVSAIRVGRVTFRGLDRSARFIPELLQGAYELKYLGPDSGSFVYEVTRTRGSGFAGKMWADSEGRLLRAEGRWALAEGVTGIYILVTGRDFFPVSMESEETLRDKNGREVSVRVMWRFFNYRKFKSEEPKVELGDFVP